MMCSRIEVVFCDVVQGEKDGGLSSVWVSTVHFVVLDQVQVRSDAIKEIGC